MYAARIPTHMNVWNVLGGGVTAQFYQLTAIYVSVLRNASAFNRKLLSSLKSLTKGLKGAYFLFCVFVHQVFISQVHAPPF